MFSKQLLSLLLLSASVQLVASVDPQQTSDTSGEPILILKEVISPEEATTLVNAAFTAGVVAVGSAAAEGTKVVNALLDNTPEKKEEKIIDTAKVAEQALEFARKNFNIANTKLTNIISDTKKLADENPDMAIIATLAGGMVAVLGTIVALDYYFDNHRAIDKNSIDTINNLIGILKNDQYTFAQRDQAYARLKKFTNYRGREYKNIYMFLTAQNGLLNSYHEYKKLVIKKQQFELMAAHINTETTMMQALA